MSCIALVRSLTNKFKLGTIHFIDMPQYIHYFELKIRKQFQSERSNFESALAEWIAAFPGDKELREHLLDADESTQDLVDAISFTQTDSID